MGNDERDALEALRAYARALRAAASRTPVPERLTRPPGGIPPVTASEARATRLVAAAAVVAFVLVGGTGLAIAADDAVPGDLLYPVDVLTEAALQAVGVPLDLTAERLGEAEVLAARGNHREALITAWTGLRAAREEPWAREAMGALVRLQATADPDPALTAEVIAAARGVADARDAEERRQAVGALRSAARAVATTAPGQTGDTPATTAPGQTGDTPATTAPGQTGDTPATTAPGRTGDTPATTAPGRTGDTPGGKAPGRGDDPPGKGRP